MAIWISWNIDIQRSLNSRDSFPTRKFKNRATTSCRPGPILSPSTISSELHTKMAEETERKVQFSELQKLRELDIVTLTLDRVEVTLLHISGQRLPTHQKTFWGRTDGCTDGQTPDFSNPISLSPGDDLKWKQVEVTVAIVLENHKRHSLSCWAVFQYHQAIQHGTRSSRCLSLHRNLTI